ncbi:hypothetical protein DI270_033470 [Microbispora triticiradicis]|uniref:Uncharacterized protein n=1 Tax=Microbispora triticiradicis TaxID=2200763 RepID=A0ABX9LBT9_9ACTN|nr:hypothetical protein DI270_033470 [Microbispora triticiradicis]
MGRAWSRTAPPLGSSRRARARPGSRARRRARRRARTGERQRPEPGSRPRGSHRAWWRPRPGRRQA